MNIVKKCQEIEKEQLKCSMKGTMPIEESLKKLCNLEIENVASKVMKIDTEPIIYCLQPLLAVQNLVNPCTETSIYISQLHMIQRLKNYSNARLYCEVIRACMMCLHDVKGTFKESHWGGFTVLKLPQILKELHASTLNGLLSLKKCQSNLFFLLSTNLFFLQDKMKVLNTLEIYLKHLNYYFYTHPFSIKWTSSMLVTVLSSY